MVLASLRRNDESVGVPPRSQQTAIMHATLVLVQALVAYAQSDCPRWESLSANVEVRHLGFETSTAYRERAVQNYDEPYYAALPSDLAEIGSKLLNTLDGFFDGCNTLSRNVTFVSDVFKTNRIPHTTVGHFELLSSIGEIQVRENNVFIFLMEYDDDHSVGVQRVLSGGGYIHNALPRGVWELARQWELPVEMRTRESRFLLQNRFVKSTLREAEVLMKGQLIDLFHWGIHETICEALEVTRGILGAYVEIGVYKGGSAATARMYMAAAGIERNMSLIDTFQGFTYDSIQDSGDAAWIGTHVVYPSPAAWIHSVRNLLWSLNLQQPAFVLHKRDIVSQELPRSLEQIAVANIDCDVFEAILASLEKVAPRVPKGGVLIMDDVLKLPDLIGARAAMDLFLDTAIGRNFAKVYKRYTIWLIKLA